MYVICMSSSTQFTSCELTLLNCKIGDSFCQKNQNLRFLRPIAFVLLSFRQFVKVLGFGRREVHRFMLLTVSNFQREHTNLQ